MAAVAQNVNRTVRFFSDVLGRPLAATLNQILSQAAPPSIVSSTLFIDAAQFARPVAHSWPAGCINEYLCCLPDPQIVVGSNYEIVQSDFDHSPRVCPRDKLLAAAAAAGTSGICGRMSQE